MTDSRTSRLNDPNQPAKPIADIAPDEPYDWLLTKDGKNLAAVLLGRRGGLKGGRARADSLTPERRSEIAYRAAATRWKRNDH